MKTKVLISIIFSFYLSVPIFGQTENNTAIRKNFEHKYAIGFCGAYTKGYDVSRSLDGLTFEYGIFFKFTPNKFGFQTTFSPYYLERAVRFSFGLTLLYNLINVERTTFYLYQGNYFDYYHSGYYNRETKDFNNGMGLGMEIIILKRVGVNLMFGYSFYKNFSEFRRKGELGFSYKF